MLIDHGRLHPLQELLLKLMTRTLLVTFAIIEGTYELAFVSLWTAEATKMFFCKYQQPKFQELQFSNV